jgi:hypothetical protein
MGTEVFPGGRPGGLAFFAGEFEDPLPEPPEL